MLQPVAPGYESVQGAVSTLRKRRANKSINVIFLLCKRKRICRPSAQSQLRFLKTEKHFTRKEAKRPSSKQDSSRCFQRGSQSTLALHDIYTSCVLYFPFFSIGVDSTRGIICRIFPVAFCRACENDATFVRSQLRFRETNFPRNIWQTFHTLVKRNVTFSIFHSHCGAIDSDYLSQCFCYFLSSLEQRHTHVYPI